LINFIFQIIYYNCISNAQRVIGASFEISIIINCFCYSNDTANAKKAGVLMLKAEEIIDSNSTIDALT